jgi:hypothetical protein
MKQNMFKFFILLKIKHTLSMSTNKKYKKNANDRYISFIIPSLKERKFTFTMHSGHRHELFTNIHR